MHLISYIRANIYSGRGPLVGRAHWASFVSALCWLCGAALVVPVTATAQLNSIQSARVLSSRMPRTWASVRWDTVWVQGGPDGTVTFGAPVAIVSRGGTVYVGDGMLHEVVALDAHTGKVKWRVSSGTGLELKNPSTLVPLENGALLVADPSTSRLYVIGAGGNGHREVTLPQSAGLLHSACALDGGTWALEIFEAGAPLVLVDTTGRIVGRRSSKFERTKNGMFAGQAQFAGESEPGACVLMQLHGEAFSWLAPDGTPGVARPYITTSSRYEALRTKDARELLPQTALSGVVGGGELWIATPNPQADSANIIDRYHSNGAYFGSLRVPRNISLFARAGDVLYIVHGFAGRPVVSALRVTVSPSK